MAMNLRKFLSKHMKICLTRFRHFRTKRTMQAIQNEPLANVVDALESNWRQLKATVENVELCEDFRAEALKSEEFISFTVFGSDHERPLSKLARKAPSRPAWCGLIYHLIRKTEARNVLEIGTNIGISGSYILSALPEDGLFVTMEGHPRYCEIADSFFSRLIDACPYRIIPGMFEKTFDAVISEEVTWDVVFIDGNHTEEPNWKYFDALCGRLNPGGLMVFDDINWSLGMKRVWSRIKADPRVRFSIDLHEIGVIILQDTDKRVGQEHFQWHYAY